MSPRIGAAPRLIRVLTVRSRPQGAAGRSAARITAGGLAMPCVLGPAGIVRRKREGDGGTPAGCFTILEGRFRADRQPRPAARLPLRPSGTRDGWCDDPRSPCYNRPVRLPFAAGHERIWRDDRLYDTVLVLDYNLRPRRPGAGSAIFLHVMATAGSPTAGCVALRPGDLRRLLPRLARGCRVQIG